VEQQENLRGDGRKLVPAMAQLTLFLPLPSSLPEMSPLAPR